MRYNQRYLCLGSGRFAEGRFRISGYNFKQVTSAVFEPPEVELLARPENLFSEAQSDFTETGFINFRSNWTAAPNALSQIQGNGNLNDARLDFDTAVTSGNPHIVIWTTTPGTTGNYRGQFGGAGSLSGASVSASEVRPKFMWASGDQVGANYTRFAFNPLHDDMDAVITSVVAYDLSSTDPRTVPCDVVLCIGDSNMSNSVSEEATQENLETEFDPRVWYMPLLKNSSTFDFTSSVRHVPQPCIEPVQAGDTADRMSPLMAFGADFVSWSAARGRPLLLLSLGISGSGLNGQDQEWRKDPTSQTSAAGEGYDELLLMLAAMRALGPDHQVVGVIASIGANDMTGADYNHTWVPQALELVNNLRAEPLIDNADLPFAWISPREGYEPTSGEDRGARMIDAVMSIDQDTGANAITGVRAIRADDSNPLNPDTPTDPHFNAAGMQENGRRLASALRNIIGATVVASVSVAGTSLTFDSEALTFNGEEITFTEQS